jgi:hypothetical protein
MMCHGGGRWPLLVASLWWGGMTALSFVAVPVLFAQLGSPALAGPVAARLFQLQGWASVVLALVLLLWCRFRAASALLQTLLPWLLLAALAGLVQEFGVAQRILHARATGDSVALWHRIGTGLVLVQWLCALRVWWCLSGAVHDTPPP